METSGAAERGAFARAQFACLLLIHKSDLGMADIADSELEMLAPAILGSLVRLSLMALRDLEQPDNAFRIAALWWFIEWACENIEGFSEIGMLSMRETVPR